MQPDERTAEPAAADATPSPTPSVPGYSPPPPREMPDIPVVGWAFGWGQAIVLGVRDTAQDMLNEGRKASREAYDEGWRDFDSKTRFRRRKP
jgi:hypothetical protein